jgi:hypothetical protein
VSDDDNQGRLFGGDDGPSHRGDPWTSFAAASSVKRSPQRLRVLHELDRAGDDGRTDSELGVELHIRETAAGTRRKELEELGLAQRTTRTRPTLYGNQALVHIITPAGHAALRRLASHEPPRTAHR